MIFSDLVIFCESSDF